MNPSDYVAALLEHADVVAADPEAWLPCVPAEALAKAGAYAETREALATPTPA